jgi:hypothetical protein
MGAAHPVGQPAWRWTINQHESFVHDSIDSLAYDWDRIGDPAGPPRPALKFYVPRTTEDVVRCVRECAELGQTLTVRSKGHSSNGLVTPVGGAVLLTEQLRGVLDVDREALTATVRAGTPSAVVDEHLATLGLGLPVIGDHADITVGGFASVGGITASSFKYGMFVDIVEAAEYVDWSGDVHVVSRTEGREELQRLLTGLGRHGVITTLTVRIIEVDKYGAYWRNDAERYDTFDGFVTATTAICTDPPSDAEFVRALWIDFPLSSGRTVTTGTLSVYRQADPDTAQRVLEKAAYGGLHRLGWMAGRLPDKADKLVKLAGTAGVILAPRYATIKNAELFTEKILDASVGDPQRFLVLLAPVRAYAEVARRVWDLLAGYRTDMGCFTFLSLYIKPIRSAYLSQGDPTDERWVEVLYTVGIDVDVMTDGLLGRIADEIDQACIDTGSLRYMHTRTGRDPDRLARIDPNARYNDGRSVHPSERGAEDDDA